MPKFIVLVDVATTHTERYEVEAHDAEAARQLVEQGDAEGNYPVGEQSRHWIESEVREVKPA